MKSIFVLTMYGLTPVVCEKLYDNNISYLDLEIYGLDIVKKAIKNKAHLSAIENVINNYLKNNQTISPYDLVLCGLNYRLYKMISTFENPFDFIELSEEEFLSKYNMKQKYYLELVDSYNKLKEENFHIPQTEDYTNMILYTISNNAKYSLTTTYELTELLSETTFPIEELENCLVTLKNKEIINYDGKTIEYLWPSITERVKNLDKRESDILTKRLQGLTLQEIANDYNITRERIRQIIEKQYEKMLRVYEDKYQSIFETYEFNKDEFCYLFQEPESTYYYLTDNYNKGNIDLFEIDNDILLNEELLARLKTLNNEIKIDNEYVPGTRDGITKYYLKKINTEISADKLLEEVNPILESYNINQYDTLHNLEALLERKTWCISGSNRKYRYYENKLITTDEIELLKNMLNTNYGFYSSLYFFENNQELMNNLDIRNEQELHNLLKNHIIDDKIQYLRMPNILIGYQNKDDFFVDIFNEYTPTTLEELVNVLRKDFGHKENTISSYLFSEYSHYITNGQVICQDTEIPQELITKLKDNFEKAIYSLPEFIDLLKSLNIDNYSNLLTNVNLSKLSYRRIGSYIINNKYSTIKDAFYEAILRREINTSILKVNSTAYTYIAELLKDKKIIENNEVYYDYNILYNIGLTDESIEELKRIVEEKYLQKDIYFTPTYLRNHENIEILNNEKLTDDMITSILLQIDSISKIRVYGCDVLTNKNINEINKKYFFKNITIKHNITNREELSSILSNEYGINISNHQLRNMVYYLNTENIYL